MLNRFLLVVIAFLPGIAFAAEPLSRSDIEKFLAVVEDIQEIDERYPDADIDISVDEDDPVALVDKLFDEQGNVRVMESVLEAVAKHEKVHAELKDSIRRAGFSSPGAFADVGDRVLIAVARADLSESDLRDMSQLESIPEQQMAAMPPSAREMMKRMSLFAGAVKDVPASDLELVREYRPQLRELNFGG